MRIICCVRTRNEETNIARFIKSYSEIADKILVADGGSTDRTLEIASKYNNVDVRSYTKVVWGDNGIWRNPEGKHLNFLYKWALQLGADWILFDDCDSFPTKDLQRNGRRFIEAADKVGKVGLLAYHIYLYGKDCWFPEMNNPGKFLWGWKYNSGLSIRDTEDWGIIYDNVPKDDRCLPIEYPFSLLHDYTPNLDIVYKKLDFYNNCGKMTPTKHPIEMGGRLAVRESWMID